MNLSTKQNLSGRAVPLGAQAPVKFPLVRGCEIHLERDRGRR